MCVAFLFFLAPFMATANSVSPMAKILQMIGDYQVKIIAEGEQTQKTYDKFVNWCEDRSVDLSVNLKTKKSRHQRSAAKVEEETAIIESLTTKIEEYSETLASTEDDVKKAQAIRDKEQSDFQAEEKELMGVIRALERATHILEKGEQSGGAALLQIQNAETLEQVLSAMVQASMFNAAGADRLQSLMQTQASDTEVVQEAADESNGDEEGESTNSNSENGSGDAAENNSDKSQPRSASVIQMLMDLSDKANAQLEDARNKETMALNAFRQVKSSLESQAAEAEGNMARAKTGLASSTEEKSVAEGDIAVLSKELKEDSQALSDLRRECVNKAEDFQAETKSRDEELKALTEAKKALTAASESTDQAKDDDSADSFMQIRATSKSKSMTAGFNGFRIVQMLRHVSQSTGSARIRQLAFQSASVLQTHSSRGGGDPFAKVKGLVTDMITKLENEASSEASKKAFCDKELSKTKKKRDDKLTGVERLSTKLDQLQARQAELKEEIAGLSKELTEIQSAQSELTQIRKQEKEEFQEQKAQLDEGIDGVKLALKILKDYYAKSGKNTGASAMDAIIGLIEQVESDFQKTLAEITAAEQSSVVSYEEASHEAKTQIATKEQDAKVKNKESAYVEKSISEISSDKASAQDVVDATLEYLKKIEGQCVSKPESYEERAKRRKEEIEGLKEALNSLDGEDSFLQKSSQRALRGGSKSS